MKGIVTTVCYGHVTAASFFRSHLKKRNKSAPPDVKAKWISIFKKLTAEKITIAPTDKDNLPFAGAKRGDTIMTVNPGDDDNALIFVLRNVGGKGWLVVAERTDY